MDEREYMRLIEAALFMSPKAMSISEIAGATGIMSMGTIQSALKELVGRYGSAETALALIEIDKRYMFSLKEPYASRVSSLSAGPDISKGALRVLAYVSKNEGVLQSGLVKLFGGSTYDHVKELAEKEFIETKRFGRSKKVSTTSKFKEYFNV